MFFITIQGDTFGAGACYVIRQRGFRVLSTSTVTSCHREECFRLFHSTPLEGAGSFVVQQKKKKKAKTTFFLTILRLRRFHFSSHPVFETGSVNFRLI